MRWRPRLRLAFRTAEVSRCCLQWAAAQQSRLMVTQSSLLEAAPGVSWVNDARAPLGDYIHARAWLSADKFEHGARGERSYNDEGQFWADALSGRLFETSRVLLRDFIVMDWLPRSPGRYYTPDAAESRRAAAEFVLERTGKRVVYDAWGKAHMVAGGIGSLRLLMKEIGGEKLQFLGATTTGTAHRGVVLAVRANDYAKIAEQVAVKGGVRCVVSGEIRFWRPDDHLPTTAAVGVPRIYVSVDTIAVRPGPLGHPLDVTPAIVFSGGEAVGDSNVGGPFFCYSHFDPANPASLDRAVDWLENSYVGDRYSGQVLTDFDERTPRFAAAACGLTTLMDPNISAGTATAGLSTGFPAQTVQIYTTSLIVGTVEGTVSSISITGDGNVVGDNNRVITTIHHGLDREGLRELGQTFALLRGEILDLDTVPERVRTRAERALADAEDELAEAEPDEETVESSLRRAAETLKSAGETFDEAEGWGRRFADVGHALSVVIPTAARWFPTLLAALV